MDTRRCALCRKLKSGKVCCMRTGEIRNSCKWMCPHYKPRLFERIMDWLGW